MNDDYDYDKLFIGIVIAILSITSTLVFIYGSGTSAGIFGTIMAILAILLICVNATY